MPAVAGPSRPSFRPRPIDLAKPLPIIKSSKDLRHEDDVVVNRALPTIATGVDPSEEEERHLQQALLASVFGNTDKPPDIPVPIASAVKPPKFKNDYIRPEHYIVCGKTDVELLHGAVEYDADFVDDKFAASTNISIDLVEIGMDALEKTQSNVETLLESVAGCKKLAQVMPALNDAQRTSLFNHWHKRRIQHKRPFIRFFQPSPDPNDPDPAVAFRPRDREAGVAIAHRMNTYDNYRRALIIRDELSRLRKILADVVEREKKKEQALSISLLLQRVRITSSASPQIDNIVKHVFCSENEQVIQLPSNRGTFSNIHPYALVPCRGIQVPSDIAVENRRLIVDKTAKKHKRKSKATDRRNSSTNNNNSTKELNATAIDATVGGDKGGPLSAQQAQQLQQQQQSAFDTFGFDEHGNRFLKLMRCFAGGFINYGVSPYDHRVFAAASERNTVRSLPREPKSVQFPDSKLKFAKPLTNTNHSSHNGRVHKGGKVGPGKKPFVTPAEIRQDILQTRTHYQPRLAPTSPLSPPSNIDRSLSSPEDERPAKQRRVIRVRGRVGRGGRVIFDRVPFERERGAKAASYPASVEMGGVYTGGIPLDAAKSVADEVSKGGMGQVSMLSPTSIHHDDNLFQMSGTPKMSNDLYAPLKPMVEIAKGRGNQPDVLNYWPHQKKSNKRSRAPGDVQNDEEEEKDSDGDGDDMEGLSVERVHGDCLRRLPAYHPRDDLSVCSLEDT